MQTLWKNFRSVFVALVIAAVVATTGYLNSVQNSLNEFRMDLWPRVASEKIVFLGIDKNSLDAVGVWPWPRSVHARAIDSLSDLGASEIAFDVDFSSPSTEAEDARLADSLRNSAASVVLPTFLQPDSTDHENSRLVQSAPIALFADEAWIASVNVVPDTDGTVRRYSRASKINDELVPSLSSVLAGAERMDLTEFPVDYSIRPETIPTFSFADLLSGSVPMEAIDGKSVLIGAHALELRDALSAPVHGVLNGPILQILAAETLIQGRVVKTIGDLAVLGIMTLLALLALILLPKIRLSLQMVTLLALACLIEAAAHYAFAAYAIGLNSAPILTFILLVAVIRTAGDLDVRNRLLRLARAEAANTRLVLDQVFEDSSDAILIINEEGTIVEENARFSQLFSRQIPDGKAADPDDFFPGRLREEARACILSLKGDPDATQSLTSKGRLKVRQNEQDRFIDYQVTPSRVAQPAENSEHIFKDLFIATITARDVTVEVEQRNQLEYLSKFDELTGAERRSEFVSRLIEQGHEEAQTTIFTLGLLRFDNLISTMGREIGDQLLVALCAKIRAADPNIAGIAKLDRATFGIRLKPALDKTIIAEFPHKLLVELSEPVVINRQAVSVDFCMGHASESIGGEEDATRLLNQAEFALREAEDLGPNGVCEFNVRTSLRQNRARQLEHEMRGALGAGEFHVVYQPQVESMTGKPVGAEALIRWINPKFGEISPSEFIEVAETTGLIVQIGQFILNQACRDALAWDDEISISVNVSPIQLSRGDVVQDVYNALKISGLAPHRLIIELTESSFIGDEAELLQKMDKLRGLGVSIVLDDFGTGYSSLGYLARFRMDKIKVDQSFVRNIAKSDTNQAILRSIKVLADGFGIKVLCEGVETESDLRVVQQLGCHEIQGFYFGKPQSTFDMIRFLAQPAERTTVEAPKLKVV